jgi:hypothetical protein
MLFYTYAAYYQSVDIRFGIYKSFPPNADASDPPPFGARTARSPFRMESGLRHVVFPSYLLLIFKSEQ